MKKDIAGNLTFSPSDLILAMQSPFASWMERYAIEQLDKIAEIKRDENALMNLLATRGNSHETNYLNYLIEKNGVFNVGIVKNASKYIEAENTLAFMREGKEVIFQARLSRGEFTGKADFLIKVEGKSKFGNYHYEAWDTKLSLSTRPYFLIQLCCYSWMLEEAQGFIPEYATIVLGNLNKNIFRITSYFDYFQRLKKNFIDFQSHFTPNFDAMPDLVDCNDYGVWTSFAEQRMKELDSLVQIANIRKSQIKKIQYAGIDTLTELATSNNTTIPRLAPQSFAKIKAQASIQKASEGLDIPKYAVQTENEKEGLYTLPAKSILDVFFDIEGHPLIEGGLEYLWGVSYQDSSRSLGKKYAFKDWWAHTPQQEKLAFEGFIDWVYDRWQRDNNMHIYHYASYEITAMRKISTRYETRGDKLAELLKKGVFIDLYKIVSKGLLIGTPSYSIKYVEHLYRNSRNTLIANGGESVVVYESWRENGGIEAWNLNDNGYSAWLNNSENFDWSQWEELNAIRVYNIDDCESTLELTAWLRSIQKENDIQYLNANEIEIAQEPQNNQNPLEIRRQELKSRFESMDDLKNDPIAQLAIDLMGFHHRERKPNVWAYFDRLEKTDEELLDDDTCLCNIEIITKNGNTYTGVFDNTQPIRTDKLIQNGGKLRGSETKIKKIELSQPNGHATTIQFSANQSIDESMITIFANEPYIRTDKLENRLCDLVEQLFDQKLGNLTNAILKRLPPVFHHSTLPINRQLFPDNNDYLDAIFSAVQAMNQSCLCIQGPPGAGKTYTARSVITRLVLNGKRVGVTSNSHAAILNLLDGLYESANQANMVKIGGNEIEFLEKYSYDFKKSMSDFTNETYSTYQIIGGTVFAFAHDIAFDSPLNYLFVDEASQVPLANLTAISGAAENIVLIGDQMQLEQPTQGSHPGESGLSALEFMLNGYHVVPEERGIFLETTYRMHPDVCKPISETVYEGKLHTDSNNIHQRISIPFGKLITKHHGILTIDAHHEGNRQSSKEEVDLIKDIINELQTGTHFDKNGKERSIIADDIMIIAPYNMQVNLLKENLGDNYAIGTIDKFQGQEAPVVIVSMVVSDPHESSRGIDFVFDINRLNVAISRAKALAIIVANPDLKNCRVTSVTQMEKSSFFLKLTSQ